jgi:uncharacterized YccA/Bax inhibitor family protein
MRESRSWQGICVHVSAAAAGHMPGPAHYEVHVFLSMLLGAHSGIVQYQEQCNAMNQAATCGITSLPCADLHSNVMLSCCPLC